MDDNEVVSVSTKLSEQPSMEDVIQSSVNMDTFLDHYETHKYYYRANPGQKEKS